MTEDHTAKDHTCDVCAADTHEFVAYRDTVSYDYDPYEEYHRQHPMYLKGAEDERKRLIELLRNTPGAQTIDLWDAIDIIKGENE